MTAPSDLLTLPEGWVWTKVGEIIEKVSLTGKKLKQSEYQKEGRFPVIDQGQTFIGGYTDKEELKVSCELPVIVFGDHTKIVKYVDFDFVAGADGVKVIKPTEVFYPKLFYYFLPAIQLPDKGYARHFQFLERSFISLPPLPEQHRIVAKIEELFTKLDAGVESLKKVKAQLKRHRQAVLKYAFEGKLTEEWREKLKDELEPASVLLERIKEEHKKTLKGKYKEAPPLDTSDLPELPEGWVWARIGEICETTSGGTPSRNNKRYYGGNIPWLKSGELENNIITSAEEYITEEGLENSSAKIIPKGTLLMALYGATVGKLGILGIDSAINQAICAIFTPTRLEKKYLFWYLMDYRNELLNSRIGGAQPNISQTIVNKTILPLPTHSEQQIIVEEIERRFSVAEEVEKVVDQSLKQAERLRHSILKTAFEGKLVPQDPSDEPASVLLEQIKGERENREIEEKSKTKTKRKRDLVQKQRRFNDYVK